VAGLPAAPRPPETAGRSAPPRLAALAAALDDGGSALAQAIEVLRWAVTDAALAASAVSDAADLPVGVADRLLLDVYERALGRVLERTVACPECGEWTTFPLAGDTVGEHWPRSAWCGPGAGVREPTYADLLLAAGDPAALLARCAVGSTPTLTDLAAVEASLCGPLRSSCAGCGVALVDDVDVMGLVLAGLTELQAELDWELHVLATAYGWDPETIDALPDARRRRLADLVSSDPGGRG